MYPVYSSAVEAAFTVLVSNISSLQGSCDEKKYLLGKEILTSFQNLIIGLNELICQLEQEDTALKKKLIRYEEENVDASIKYKKATSKHATLEESLANLKKTEGDLDNDLKETNDCIKDLEKKIEHEDTLRTDAWTDSIPLVGQIGAIVTGRGLRAIPGYSLIAGIISVIAQDKEAAEERLVSKSAEKSNLSSQMTTTKENIKKREEESSSLKKTIQRLDILISSTTFDIKLVGKELTALRRIVVSFNEISIGYNFLQRDLEFRIDPIAEGMLDDTKIIELLQKMRKIQRSFHLTEEKIHNRRPSTRKNISYLDV